ncbi:MAG: hypothetical protein OEX97_00520 [Acidimicrobiia bacterium]|nr:hypothetical protein [Acidimicrobiia bacterium]
MSAKPSASSDTTVELPAAVRKRLQTLRNRYGRQRTDDAGHRMELAVNRRRLQLAEINQQIADLEQRARVIRSELQGFGKGMTLLAEETIAEYERAFPEAWSPSSVLGYRVWVINGNGLIGARQVWETPVLVAECAEFPDVDEVPHTDNRCGRLGCGVYATKELKPLLDLHVRERDRNYAAGLVAMEGKVVEHEDGYRAARAEVVSMALIGQHREVYTTDSTVIAAAFTSPDEAIDSQWSRSLREPVLEHIEAHLTERMEERWI